MNDGVELPRQRREEVMAHSLRARQIDHADRALQPLLLERGRLGIPAQRQQKVRDPEFMKEQLVTSAHRFVDLLPLRRRIPLRCGRDRSGVRRESDQSRVVAVRFANQLSDVQLTAASHLRRARIAEV